MIHLPRKTVAFVLVLLCAAACTAQATPGSRNAEPPVHLTGFARGPRSSNLADFVRMPGDQVVVVPNGVYHAGDIEAPHPATSGRLKGWLVLLAQSQGGAVVDLTNARLWLGPDTTRVMFVGFTFVNGSIFVEGQDIDFWYTQHTFPASTWVAQSHNPTAPETGYYRAPRAVYVRADTAQHVHFYGSDVHDTGTGFSVANATDVLLEGVNVWNITDAGLDPHDVIHPDAISSIGGGIDGFTVADSWIRGRILIEDITGNPSQGGPVRGMLFRNVWASNSPSVSFTFTSDKLSNPRGIFGARDGVRSWGSNSGEDRTEIIDGTQYHYANTVPSRINVADTNISTSPPRFGAISPAYQWRIDHPYASWADVLNH